MFYEFKPREPSTGRFLSQSQAEWGSKEATGDDEDATFGHIGQLRRLSRVPGEKTGASAEAPQSSQHFSGRGHMHAAHGVENKRCLGERKRFQLLSSNDIQTPFFPSIILRVVWKKLGR